MKRYHKIAISALTVATIGAGGYFVAQKGTNAPQPQISPTPAPVSGTSYCNADLWNYVYHPARLQKEKDCTMVSGTIYSVKREPDGDLHIRLTVDPAYKDLINPVNVSGQKGMLVLEPVCQKVVTQADAIDTCKNFPYDKLVIPKVGVHVQVWGSFVLDLQHGGWAEIHPVTSIKSIP